MKEAAQARRLARLALAGWAGLTVLSAWTLEDPAEPTDAPPAVIESIVHEERWENDGTGRIRVESRIRIETEAGRQGFGQSNLAYLGNSYEAEFEYIRVIKPSGEVVSTPLDNVLDVDAQPTQMYPMYSDLRYKVVPVSGLQVGDVLEQATVVRAVSPMIPGHFYQIVLPTWQAPAESETITLDLPADRVLSEKIHGAPPDLDEIRDGRRVRRWNLKSEKVLETAPDPVISFSTFRTWEEFGAWYRHLAAGTMTPDDSVRQLAERLTEGAGSDREKVDRLYRHVAQSVRYVGISFGLGRYRPRAAPTTLVNEYGDCKDKHALLAALLASVGIPSHVVLSHSISEIEPEVPSPFEFNHVMSAVDLPEGRVWLDATQEWARPGVLAPLLRGREVLVVYPETAKLEKVPEAGEVEDFREMRLAGSIDDAGDLEADVEITTSGWWEMTLRPVCSQLEGRVLEIFLEMERSDTGLAGEILDPRFGDAKDLDGPFRHGYRIRETGFLDPLETRVEVTIPWLLTGEVEWVPDEEAADENAGGEEAAGEEADADGGRAGGEGSGASPVVEPTGEEAGHERPVDEDAEDAWLLGGPMRLEDRVEIRLPEGVEVILPEGIRVDRPFATYRSAFRLEEGVLHVERRVELLEREVAAALREDARTFSEEVKDDVRRKVSFVRSRPADVMAVAERLDGDQLAKAATRVYEEGAHDDAFALAEKAAGKDPKQAHSWNLIGWLRLHARKAEEAAKAFERAQEIAPGDEYSARFLAGMSAGAPEKRLELARGRFEADPDDPAARANYGLALDRAGRLEEAEEMLRKALEGIPQDNGMLHSRLGSVVLRLGRTEEALGLFDRALERNRSPMIYNDIAYALAEAGVELDRAYRYASSAASRVRAEVALLDSLRGWQQSMLMQIQLSAVLDTVGWVEYRRGRTGEALAALEASLRLVPDRVGARHACEVAAAAGLHDRALFFYALESMMAGARPFGDGEALPLPDDLDTHVRESLGGRDAIDGRLVERTRELLAWSGRYFALDGGLTDPEPKPKDTRTVTVVVLVDASGAQVDRVVVEGAEPWASAALSDVARMELAPARMGEDTIAMLYPLMFSYSAGAPPSVARIDAAAAAQAGGIRGIPDASAILPGVE